MAQKIQVLLVCDVHDGEVEGTETVSFALDGSSYEIDVCEAHGAELRDSFAYYVGHARRAGRVTAARTSGKAKRSGRAVVSDNNEVRAWARANGFEVGERGRMPAAVHAAYKAAH